MIPCNIRKSGLSRHARAGFKIYLNPNTSEDANYRRTDETAMQLALTSSKYGIDFVQIWFLRNNSHCNPEIGKKSRTNWRKKVFSEPFHSIFRPFPPFLASLNTEKSLKNGICGNFFLVGLDPLPLLTMASIRKVIWTGRAGPPAGSGPAGP